MDDVSLEKNATSGDENSGPNEDPREEMDFSKDQNMLERIGQDWRDHMSDTGGIRQSTSEEEERRQHFYDSLTTETSLQQHLMQQAELAEVSGSAKSLDQARKRQAELVITLATLGRILEDRQTSMELFEAISRSMPDGLWLTEVKRSATTVQVDGRASSLSAITALVRRLGENLAFDHSPEIRSVSTEGAEGSQILRFQVAGELALADDRAQQ